MGFSAGAVSRYGSSTFPQQMKRDWYLRTIDLNGSNYAGSPAVAGLIGFMLVLRIAVGGPGASARLPTIPQTLNGIIAEITVDGEPYDDTTPIEVLDEVGTVLGTVDIANGVWVFRVDKGPTEAVLRIGLAVIAPISYVEGVLTSVVITATIPDIDATSTVSLNSGFQALTDLGSGLPIDEFLGLV